MTHLNIALRGADAALEVGNYQSALDWLSKAREIARQGNTQRMKAVAAHCTVAIQALLPVRLEGLL